MAEAVDKRFGGRDDPRSTEQLVDVALTEPDEDEAWNAVASLHLRGTQEVFEVARELCASEDADRRALGADILGQLGTPDRPFREQSVDMLLAILEVEEDTSVLCSLGIALGHLEDPRCIDPLLRFIDHPGSDVRYGVSLGLGGTLSNASGDSLDRAIRGLIKLSDDADVEVRDWTTFGLGSEALIGLDMPEIDEALMRRVDDEDPTVRAEAFRALGLRRDRRAAEQLAAELNCVDEDGYDLDLLLEAVTEVPDPSLCPVLLRLKTQGITTRWLDDAIAACGCADPSTPDDETAN